ncbi:protein DETOXIFICATION 49-like [Curcuma longa]|uniref:protein DETOXIFICATION 49-like n=1 Tax=Curcuma longa TaxID=136217 RepID=UPI003D9EB19C
MSLAEPGLDQGLIKPWMKKAVRVSTRSNENMAEAKRILALASPIALTGLLLYSRSLVSMIFLGCLGRLPLAGGALAIGFANITGYSVLSGLAMGMEPLCGQAVGAHRPTLLGPALHRAVLLLLVASLPIAALWLTMDRLLLLCGQDADVAAAAYAYVLSSLPDLIFQSFLHPIRIFLRSQSITLPLTYATVIAALLHLPLNYVLVFRLRLGIHGVAIASVCTNLNILLFLLLYIFFADVHCPTGVLNLSTDCFRGWRLLLGFAIPSVVSVCLEWWWYEIMVLLCGLLLDPKSTVASMGIIIQTTSLIYIFPSSLSFSISTRIANELGADRPDRAHRAANVGLACSAVLGLLAFLFAVAVRHVWPSMFTSDASIVALTATVLPVVGACELGNCPQTVGCGVLRGSARPRVGANINLGSFYGVGMPVAMALAFWAQWDFIGLWIGMLAAQAACVTLMLLVVRRTDWELLAQRARQLIGGRLDSAAADEAAVVAVQNDKDEKQLEETAITESNVNINYGSIVGVKLTDPVAATSP